MFEDSTQQKHWFMRPEALKQLKEQINTTSMDKMRGLMGKYKEKDWVVSVAEEEALKTYYILKIQDICRSLKFPVNVMATAVVYFQRFYLKKPLYQYQPKYIMLACIYLAGKVVEIDITHVIPAKVIAEPLKVSPKILLDLEIPLLEGLDFELIVFHPFTCLYGFMCDIKSWVSEAQNTFFTEERLQKLEALSKQITETIWTTDAVFLFSPSQIALRALHSAATTLRENKDDRPPLIAYISSRFHQEAGFNKMLEDIKNLSQYERKGTAIAQARDKYNKIAVVVTKKIKLCEKPLKRLKRKREKKQKEAMEKRKREELQTKETDVLATSSPDDNVTESNFLKRRKIG